MQWFRGGLAFKADRLLYRSILGLTDTNQKNKTRGGEQLKTRNSCEGGARFTSPRGATGGHNLLREMDLRDPPRELRFYAGKVTTYGKAKDPTRTSERGEVLCGEKYLLTGEGRTLQKEHA